MFLEQCGKLFFLKIRPAFFFALVALPLLIATFFLYEEGMLLQDLQERFRAAFRKERIAMERKERKERFLNRYSHANPYFLDQIIESFPLLQKEEEKLGSLINHPAFPESGAIKERIAFIQENRLIFKEEKIETSTHMKEVFEKQRQSVQMDERDLKQILALVEDIPIEGNTPKIDSPQILIKDFRLKKIETPLQTEVFEVEMDLIKREFIKIMKRLLFLILTIGAGCHYSSQNEPISLIQIQDRNGLTETISNPDRLITYENIDFLSSQPYRKVSRIYKNNGKSKSRITSYHPNGVLCQYLEAEEMRAHGMYREWFPNGQMKIEAKVIGGIGDLAPGVQEDWVFDSVSKVWDEKGNLIALIPYNKGVLEGISVYYFPNGKIEKEVAYVKNGLEGVSIEYWPSGNIKTQTEYKKGTKQGPSCGFFETGRAAWVETYSDGRLVQGSYYNKDYNLISEVVDGGGFLARFEEDGVTLIEYRAGLINGLIRKFTPHNELIKSFYMKNRMKQGEEIDYFVSSELENGSPTPTPKLSVMWKENRIHGSVKTWYNNGQIQNQREYCRNQRMGPSLAWYRDGGLMLYEEYEEDRLANGQYYKKHKKEPVSSIANGNGLATLFDEDGGFLRKVAYFKGKPVDPEE